MAAPPDDGPDAAELLHLALRASRRGEVDAALGHIARGLALAPADARLHHLEGGLLAGRGETDAALAAMARAVALDPHLWGAHFQHGLLLSTHDRVADARRAWAPLDALPPSHPLRLFKTGLEALEAERYDACVEHLAAGIAANVESAALNVDMQRVIDTVHARR